jgi:MoxR-like ATPase
MSHIQPGSYEDVSPARTQHVARSIDEFRERFVRITDQIGRRIVGHEDIVNGTVTSLLAGGHVLLEGIPGVGKTSLVHTLANVLHLKFSRIQFTPDLMPADIVGTNIIQEHSHGGTFFEFQPGPIFANVVLADEINRATPKTQSALLEAMQDVSVSVGKTTYQLEEPFLVLATQNPLEMEGTYPLPEAQLDRFFFKLKVKYPAEEAMHEILERTTRDADPTVTRVVDGPEILEMRRVARSVPIARPVQGYAIRLTLGSHPTSEYATPLVKRYVRYGASPRAAQALVLAGKIQALNRAQAFVSVDDIRSMALPALRHRLLLNFEGEADEVDTDAIIMEMLQGIRTE